MIMAPFDYAAPESLAQAVTLRQRYPDSQFLAGGQELLGAMKLQRIKPSLLIDLGNIRELRGITRRREGGMQIGAMTPLIELIEHPDTQASYPALVEASMLAGDPQVRNRSTIGGSLASDSPGKDVLAAVLAFAATLSVVGPNGTRIIRTSDHLAGPFKLELTAGEILTAIDLPGLATRSSSTYETFKDRASGRAICGVAANIALASDDSLRLCHVAVTGLARWASRLPEIESALIGTVPGPEDLTAACKISGEQDVLSDLAASAEYRAYLMRILSERALTRAIARAQKSPG